MSLEPGAEVEAHFDVNPYWYPRVRVHVPIWTNKKVKFSCGQKGEMTTLNMKVGKAYLFDNHLGHSVKNGGKTRRVHLTVDLVGSRKFWALVQRSKAIGASPKAARDSRQPLRIDSAARVAVEAWKDSDLQTADCSALVEALAATAAQLGLEAEGRALGEAWCEEVEQGGKQPRRFEVAALQRLAAKRACPDRIGFPGLAEVADSVAELHRLSEAAGDLKTIGGQHVP